MANVPVPFVLLLALLLSACSPRPLTQEPAFGPPELALHTIYVVNHGWHTGLVLPTQQLGESLPALKQRFPYSPYIEFGWGDQDFYQAKNITTGLVLRALFWPTDSVIHAVAVPTQVTQHFIASDVIELCLTQAEMKSLIKFVENSFERDQQGQLRTLTKGIYGNSQFYQGVGNYYLMNTCNSWTAKGLQNAGLAISPSFKLSAASVMNKLEALQQGNQRQQCQLR